MKKLGILSSQVLLALLAGQASAHLDHANAPVEGFGHLLTDPVHLALIALASVGAVLIALGSRRARAARSSS